MARETLIEPPNDEPSEIIEIHRDADSSDCPRTPDDLLNDTDNNNNDDDGDDGDDDDDDDALAAELTARIAAGVTALGQLMARSEADIVDGFQRTYRVTYDFLHPNDAQAPGPSRSVNTDSLACALSTNLRQLFNTVAIDAILGGPSSAAAPRNQIPKSKIRARSDFKALARRWDVNCITLAAEFGIDRNHKFWQELLKVSSKTPWPQALAALTRARLTRQKMPRLSRTTRWVLTDIKLCLEGLAEHATLSACKPDQQSSGEDGRETGDLRVQDQENQEDPRIILAEASNESDMHMQRTGVNPGHQQDHGEHSIGNGPNRLADTPLEQPRHNMASAEENIEQGRKQNLTAARTNLDGITSPVSFLQSDGRRQKRVKFQGPPAMSHDDCSTVDPNGIAAHVLESPTPLLSSNHSEQDDSSDWVGWRDGSDGDDEDNDKHVVNRGAADAGGLALEIQAAMLVDGSDHSSAASHKKHEPVFDATAKMGGHASQAMQTQKPCSPQVRAADSPPRGMSELPASFLKNVAVDRRHQRSKSSRLSPTPSPAAHVSSESAPNVFLHRSNTPQRRKRTYAEAKDTQQIAVNQDKHDQGSLSLSVQLDVPKQHCKGQKFKSGKEQRRAKEMHSHSFACLEPEMWLDDNVIFGILNDFCDIMGGAFIAIDPLIMQNTACITAGRLSRRYSQHSDAILLAPVLIEVRQHWLLAVIDPRRHEIRVYDSLPGSSAQAHRTATILRERVSRLMESELKVDEVTPWLIKPMTCAQQPNSYDCGVSTIICALLEIVSVGSVVATRLLSRPDWTLWRRLVAWWVETKMPAEAELTRQVQEKEREAERPANDTKDNSSNCDGENDGNNDSDDSASITSACEDLGNAPWNAKSAWLFSDPTAAANAAILAQLRLSRYHESELIPKRNLGAIRRIPTTLPMPQPIGNSDRNPHPTHQTIESSANDATERQRLLEHRRTLFESASALQQVLEAVTLRTDEAIQSILNQIPGAQHGNSKSIRSLLVQAEQDFSGDLELRTLLQDRVATEKLREIKLKKKVVMIEKLRASTLDPVIARVFSWKCLLGLGLFE